MTINNVHKLLNLRLDEIDSHYRDYFKPEELDIYINLAITNFINEQISLIRDNKELVNEELLYKGRLVTENLQTLIKVVNLPLLNLANNEYVSLLPFDYFKYLDSFVNGDTRYENIFLELTSYNRYKNVKHNQPYYDVLPITIISNKIHCLSNTTPSTIELYYIKQFVEVDKLNNITIPLPDSTHKDIIDKTVNIMLVDLNLSTKKND